MTLIPITKKTTACVVHCGKDACSCNPSKDIKMNKELTAMQMLIEELSQRKDSNTVRMVIAMIKANYLQKEQEQIEQSFADGVDDGISLESVSQTSFEDSEDYYQSKYGGEDVDR